MKVLLIGATGKIGSAVAALLPPTTNCWNPPEGPLTGQIIDTRTYART